MNDVKQEQDGNTVLHGEVEDARTGEIIPIGEPLDIPNLPKQQANTLATTLDLTKVGTLVLDEKAESVLSEPLKPEDVKIRPDGLVYLPWTWYADRLNKAFGRLAWGLVPQAGPQKQTQDGNTVLVVWGHWLVIRGVAVGFEIGETSYRPDNLKMSFGDASAGAKSNSLARNCKMLGISLELWDADWVGEWKKKFAETYQDKGRTLWRKKAKSSNGVQPQQKVTEPAKVEATEEVKATPEPVAEKPAVAVEETPDDPKVEKLSVSKLRTLDVVKTLASKSGKKNSEVANVINKLNPKTSYSIDEVVAILKG